MRHRPRPRYPRGTSIEPDPPELILKLSTTTMWNAWLPLHLEWTCTGYVPLGGPEKATATSAGGARAAAAESGEGEGLASAEGDAMTDGAAREVIDAVVEHDAAATSASAAAPTASRHLITST